MGCAVVDTTSQGAQQLRASNYGFHYKQYPEQCELLMLQSLVLFQVTSP